MDSGAAGFVPRVSQVTLSASAPFRDGAFFQIVDTHASAKTLVSNAVAKTSEFPVGNPTDTVSRLGKGAGLVVLFRSAVSGLMAFSRMKEQPLSDEKHSRRQRSPPPDGAAFVGVAHGASPIFGDRHGLCRLTRTYEFQCQITQAGRVALAVFCEANNNLSNFNA